MYIGSLWGSGAEIWVSKHQEGLIHDLHFFMPIVGFGCLLPWLVVTDL